MFNPGKKGDCVYIYIYIYIHICIQQYLRGHVEHDVTGFQYLDGYVVDDVDLNNHKIDRLNQGILAK
jgi:hypothetical protein